MLWFLSPHLPQLSAALAKNPASMASLSATQLRLGSRPSGSFELSSV